MLHSLEWLLSIVNIMWWRPDLVYSSTETGCFLSQQAIHWVGFKPGFSLGARSNQGSVLLPLAALCSVCPPTCVWLRGQSRTQNLGLPFSECLLRFPSFQWPRCPRCLQARQTWGNTGCLPELLASLPDPDLLLGIKNYEKWKITSSCSLFPRLTPLHNLPAFLHIPALVFLSRTWTWVQLELTPQWKQKPPWDFDMKFC